MSINIDQCTMDHQQSTKPRTTNGDGHPTITNAIEQDGTVKFNDRPSMQIIGAQQHNENQRPSANANYWCTLPPPCHYDQSTINWKRNGGWWPMNTFNNKPEKWAQEIKIKIEEQPVKLQRDQRWNCAVIVSMEIATRMALPQWTITVVMCMRSKSMIW